MVVAKQSLNKGNTKPSKRTTKWKPYVSPSRQLCPRPFQSLFKDDGSIQMVEGQFDDRRVLTEDPIYSASNNMQQQRSSDNLIEVEVEGNSCWSVSSIGKAYRKGVKKGNTQEAGGSRNGGGSRKGCSGMHYQPDLCTSGMSIPDNSIKNCNRLILESLSMDSARKCWELGKMVGVNYEGNEEAVIQKILEMEERDRKIISIKGADKSYL